MAAAEDREESEEVEQESDHRAGIVSGSGPIDQPLALRPGFWRGTGLTPATRAFVEAIERFARRIGIN